MIRFECDYGEGCHPAILERLAATNFEQTPGYGEDIYCQRAAERIKEQAQCPDAQVHFLVGGTQANMIVIASILRPHQGVIAAVSGHINAHETGAVEATGHKILTVPSEDGKISAAQIQEVYDAHYQQDGPEHTVQPGMVYISQSTENGTVYTKAELEALSTTCRKLGLPLFLDGARLGYGLAASDLTLADVARLCDVFYIGGTKVGALFGEALVVMNDAINDHFRYMVKRACALFAKGKLISIQMRALLEGGEDSLYYQIGRHENELAIKLAEGVTAAGYKLWLPHQTNQVFVIMSNEKIAELEKDFFFYTWCPYDENNSVIRLVIGWGSTEDDVNALLAAI